MDTHHLLLNYSAWMKKRREMGRKYDEEEQGKLRMVRQLMSLRTATPAVLGFVVATCAGQRARQRNRRLKIRRWKRTRPRT